MADPTASDIFAQNPYTQDPYRAIGGQTIAGGPANAALGLQKPFNYPNNNPRSVPTSRPGGAMGARPGFGAGATVMHTGVPTTPYGSPQGFHAGSGDFASHYMASGGLAGQAARGGFGGSGGGGGGMSGGGDDGEGGGGGGGRGMSWNTTPKDLEVQAQRSAQRIGNKDGVMASPSPQQNWGLGTNPNMGSTDNWWRLQGINPHGTPGPSVSHPTGSPTPGNVAGTAPTPQDDFEEENDEEWYPEPSQIHPGTVQSGGAQDYPDAGIVPTAYGGTRMHRAIVGDPQADGGPNPELVEAYGPIRVTPLRNLSQRQAYASWARLPHYYDGTDPGATPPPITSPLGDTNLSSDSIPPPAPPFFQDAAPLPGFSAVNLSPNPPPGFGSGSGAWNANPSPQPPPKPLPPSLDIHTDPGSYLQPGDSAGQAPPFLGPGNTASPSIVNPNAFAGKKPMPDINMGSGWLNAYPSLPPPPQSHPYFHTDDDSLLQPEARLPLFRGAPLPSADFHTDPFSPLQPTGPGSNDAAGSISADLASPVPFLTPRLDDTTSLFGGPDSSDVPPPAPDHFIPPIGLTPNSAGDLGAAMGLKSPRLDQQTKWGTDGPGSFSKFDPSLSEPNDGFLKPYEPHTNPAANSQGRQPYPPSPLLDPSARSLDTPAQHEDYIPDPRALEHAPYVFHDGYSLDADGSPNAYGGPGKQGLDHPENAMKYHKDKYGHKIYDGFDPKIVAFEKGKHEPYVQGPNDPSPGSYVAMTTLKDSFYPKETDVRRYVDSENYPYIVMSPDMAAAGVRFGDIATVINQRTGEHQNAIIVDQGPRDKRGEISIRLARDLKLPANAWNQDGDSQKNYTYIVYPQSRSVPVNLKDEHGVTIRTSTFIPSPDSIRARGEALFKAVGNAALQKAPPSSS